MEPLTADDPRQVSVYRLQARLGAGGMGRVYLASSPGGRAVALKVVHPELARDPEFMTRFRREVEAAEAVSGAYTAPVIGAGPDDSPPWLATAYVPGPSLAELVRRAGPLPEAAVWRLAGGLVEALQAIHRRGLVHRDLKPGNILIAADGPRVIDFGISRALHGMAITTARTTMGTPAYMSPEQAAGVDIGPASDVFSLGSVLAFAAAGSAPFDGGDTLSVIYRIVHSDPDLSRLPPQLRRLISWCMTKDPAGRPSLEALPGAAQYMEVQPKQITDSGDGSGYVKDLVWSDWGSAQATATGTQEVNDCNPNCAQGSFTGYPATVTLAGLTAYGTGLEAYSTIVIQSPSDNGTETYTKDTVPS
jgi:serine/threonine protein kinase